MNTANLERFNDVEFFSDDGELVTGTILDVSPHLGVTVEAGDFTYRVSPDELFEAGTFKGYDPNDTQGSWNLTAIEWLMCTMHNLNFGEVYNWWNDLPLFVTDCLSRRYTSKLQFGQEEVMFHFYMGREGKLGAEILDIIEAEWGLSRKGRE